MSRSLLMENSVRPYFEANLDANLHKNMVIEIEDHEFYVKYCRPFFGKISEPVVGLPICERLIVNRSDKKSILRGVFFLSI